MDESDEQDRYVAQLQEVFNSCDPNGSGYLDRHGVTLLCQRLQLDEQAPFFVQHLLKDDPNPLINFKEFKDEFISLLTHSIGQPEQVQSVTSPEREISPKYVHGNKKYGRRSQPQSQDTDSGEERISDVSDSEVFYNESSHYEESGIDGAYADMDIMEHDGYSEHVKYQSKSKNLNKRKRKSSTELKAYPSTPKYDESETDYLRDVWKKLAVGTDGYLDLAELERVCEHIGMEKMSQEVVSQLFAKLDTDHDGKISFEEFVNVFQSGEAVPSRGAAVGSSTSTITKEECRETTIGNIPESGMFSSLDVGNTGIASAEAVIDLWESLGFSNGLQMLKDLGMGTATNIRLQELSNILEEALTSCDDPQLRQMAFATMNWELRYLRNCLDQLKTERDKLKTDVSEANLRAALLAQEVDDQNAKLEKSSENKVIMVERKCKEQIQSLIDDHTAEREQLNAQILKLRQTLDFEEKHWREDDNNLKEKLEQEQKENARLEGEIKELTEKLTEMEKLNQRHQKDLESLGVLRQKLEELESGELVHETKYKSLLAEMEKLKLDNQKLTDCNDELALKVESLQQQLAARPPARHTPSHKRNGSWLGEYIQNTSAKRRGNGLNLPNDDSVDHSQKMAKVHSKSPEVYEEFGTDMDDYDPYEDDSPYPEIIPVHSQPLQTPASSIFEMKQVFQFLKNKMYSEFMNECEDDLMLSLKNLENQNNSLHLQLKELQSQHDQELAQCREEFERTFELEIGKWRKKWLDLQSELEREFVTKQNSDAFTQTGSALPAVGSEQEDSVAMLQEYLRSALEQLQQEEKIVCLYKSLQEEYKKLEDGGGLTTANVHIVQECGDTFLAVNTYDAGITASKKNEWMQKAAFGADEESNSKKLTLLLHELQRFQESYEMTKKLLNESYAKHILTKDEKSQDKGLSDELVTLRKISSDLKSKCGSLEQELSSLKNGISGIEKPPLGPQEELELVREQHLEFVQEQETFWKAKMERERNRHEMELIQLRNKIVHLETRLKELAESNTEILSSSEDSSERTGDSVQDAEITSVAVLEDSRQTEQLIVQNSSTNGSEYSTAVQTVNSDMVANSRYLEEELRCREEKYRALEEQLAMQIKSADKAMKLVKEQHQSEIHQLKIMLANTRSMLQQHTEEYDARLEKADELVQKLYLENSQLVKALQVTEERQKKAEQLNTHLHERCNALTQLVSDIYKIA